MNIVQNRILRFLLFSLGIFSLILGFIGLLLPVIPTTPFVLLAAWCFLRTSPKAHEWIYRQPFIGESLKDWDEYRAIKRGTKIVAITMMCFSAATIWFTVPIRWVQVALNLILLAVSIFIGTRPDRPQKAADSR